MVFIFLAYFTMYNELKLLPVEQTKGLKNRPKHTPSI